MSFEEEFDSIIRRKAEEEKFPFDESNWDKTSSLLDAERKASRALKLKRIYLPAVLILVFGSAGFITLNYFNNNNSSGEQIASATKTVLPAENSSTNLLPGENKITQSITLKNNTKENKIAFTEKNPASINITKKHAASIATIVSEPVRVFKNSEVSKNISPDKINSTVEKENSASKNINQSANPLQSEGQNNNDELVINETPIINTEKEIKTPPQIPADNLTPGIANTQNSVPVENNIPAQNDKTSVASEYPNTIVNLQEIKLNADQLGAVFSTLPFEVAEQELMSTPFIYLNRYDDDYYKNGKNPKTHYLNIELGANYLLGWNAQHGKDGQGLNWFAGFNYGRYFSKKISVSLGLQAYNISNIKQPFYQVASKEYGFGSKNIYTRVTSNDLYYIALPLKFNYAVNSSNIIGFGINAGYLVSTKNTVSKYYLLDNEEKTIGSSTSENKGVYKGTNLVNVMLSAHYKTQFGKRLGLNLEFNYGLTDIFKNTAGIKTSETPIGIRLGLSYTLFDK